MTFSYYRQLTLWSLVLLLSLLAFQHSQAQGDIYLPLVTNGSEFEESEEEELEVNGTIPTPAPDTAIILKNSERLQASCSAGSLRVLRPKTSSGRTDSTKVVLYCQNRNVLQAAAVDAQTVNLQLNQSLAVNCNGDRLRALRPKTASGKTDSSKVILECRGPAATNPTATPPPTATTQPGTATATPTPTNAQPGAAPTATRPPTQTPTAIPTAAHVTVGYPLVFVSRQIPANGSDYYHETGSLPGVGPYSRFQVSAPGQLVVRAADGARRILLDGANPTAASLQLIDVSSPEVSYDGTQIVFAGLTNGAYDRSPLQNPGAWRIYAINVDGQNLRQITVADRDNLDLSQFGPVAPNFVHYDDFTPNWLPDGRIVFASTRWPGFSMYSAARTSNLYVINADGSELHRITAERNGADRPLVDPLTGKIVYARWWRNFRVATNSLATIVNPGGGYIQRDGLLAINHSGQEGEEVGGVYNLERNSWHLATINPDGTGLAQWGGQSNTTYAGVDANQAYGGSFAPDGSLYTSFFPMANLTEAAGFGGIRRYPRGPHRYTPIIGITTRTDHKLVRTSPPSYGIEVGSYAAEPEVLPDGRVIIAWAADIRQDYGLYVINSDGSNLTLLYDNPGTVELQARLIRPRPLPPVLPDQVTQVASLLPPSAAGPYDGDGTFTFEALNVYFNGPVDTPIINAMPVGSAGTIRFFLDQQRAEQQGSTETLDWPILLEEVTINPDGSVKANSPANVPLFEQIRTPRPDYTVPLLGNNVGPSDKPGAAHVAGLNFGRPGTTARCVGCHAGHTLIPVPADPAEAKFTNLAPGAAVSFSSTSPHVSLDKTGRGLIDRQVLMGLITDYWRSDAAQAPNQQWVQLTFPVPVTVRTVRLYNPRPGDATGDSDLQVQQVTVRLYSDAAATSELASSTVGPVAVSGTDVAFNLVRARTVRVYFNNITGTLEGQRVASLAEVEVIARGEAAQ